MNPELARKTIVETFREKFDDARFLYFIRHLFHNRADYAHVPGQR
jgi:hypothetical protein